MLLQDMYDNYWSHGTDWDISGRTNSGGSIKLYGHQRKVQEQMVGGHLPIHFAVKVWSLDLGGPVGQWTQAEISPKLGRMGCLCQSITLWFKLLQRIIFP